MFESSQGRIQEGASVCKCIPLVLENLVFAIQTSSNMLHLFDILVVVLLLDKHQGGVLTADPGSAIESGGRASFWRDVWCSRYPLCRMFPSLYSISRTKNSTVVDTFMGIVGQHSRWFLGLNSEALNFDQLSVERLTNMLQDTQLNGLDDRRNSVLAQTNLQKRGFRLAAPCGFYMETVEDTEHLFCLSFCLKGWEFFGRFVRARDLLHSYFRDRLLAWNTGIYTGRRVLLWKLLSHAICWALSKERNYRAFEGVASSFCKIIINVIELVWSWSLDEPSMKSEKLDLLIFDWENFLQSV